MSKIFVTGDTHHNIDIAKLYREDFKDATGVSFREITKDDYLIVCGDFGIVWFLNSLRRNEEKMINWYNSKPWTTLFIDGNHENFDRLQEYPIETWNGGKIHRISDSIIHLMRGQVFNIDNQKFFTMGGATSIDKMYRQINVSWWPQELPSHEEYEEALDNLQKHDYTVDYILTHCCSTKNQAKLLKQHNLLIDSLNMFFEELENNASLQYKHWYFGHYHVDKQVDDKHTCLYNDIIQIK